MLYNNVSIIDAGFRQDWSVLSFKRQNLAR